MKTLLKKIAQRLIYQNALLAVAESCTGGMLAEYVTSVSGSSKWFDCGWVTYSNQAKIGLLGVSPQTLDRYGAVSSETVKEMVGGIFARSNAQYGLAISGIAGPTGGSVDKPVGTVWIALGVRDQEPITRLFHLVGNRRVIRQLSTKAALQMLWEVLC